MFCNERSLIFFRSSLDYGQNLCRVDMTSRGARLFLSAVAFMLPLLRVAATADAYGGLHAARHRPVQQRRVPPVAPVRIAQALRSRVSAVKDLSRRSRASQPFVLSAANSLGDGMAVSRLSFPLRL